MAHPGKPAASSAPSSALDAPAPYTVRGRALDAPLVTTPKANPLGDPIMGRQRSNSLRRLTPEHLAGLADHGSSAPTPLNLAASRELGVRHAVVEQSQRQFVGKPVLMNALGPVGMREASAMRFASSMAEEAQDEVNRKPSYKPQQIGQAGIASVGGHLGFGISGQGSKMAHARNVEEQMLSLQSHYDKAGQSGHWSARLVPAQVSDIFAQDDANICAAKRASHVAHSVAASASGIQPPARPVPREAIPPPDSLLEMMNNATSGRGNFLSNYTVGRNGPPSRHETDAGSGATAGTVTGRTRSSSVGNMANSCVTCMAEHEHHMKSRTRSASSFE